MPKTSKDVRGVIRAEQVAVVAGFVPGFGLSQIREYYFKEEPRMSANITVFRGILKEYWDRIDAMIELVSGDNPDSPTYEACWQRMEETIEDIPDAYWRMTLWSMVAYRSHKKGRIYNQLVWVLINMPECSWKYSCLRFLHGYYKNNIWFENLYSEYKGDIVNYII